MSDDKSGKRPPRKRAPRRLSVVDDPPEVDVVVQFPGGESQAEGETQVGAGEVEVFEPAYEAHKLKLAGFAWEEVARATGFPSVQAAIVAVDAYLQQAATLQSNAQRTHAFTMQLQRYERVLAAWFPAAVVPGPNGQPDKDAAALVLRLLGQLDRLQRLGESEDETVIRTIVISGSPEEYTRSLQQAYEETRGGS